MDARAERLAFAAALAACLALAVVALGGRMRPAPVAHHLQRDDVVAHVTGRVVRPGSYRLPWGSRVEDLVAVAGGVAADADPTLVAWSSVLTDGASVVVPARADDGGDARVDVNAASERLLTTLPGVGPVTAARIVAARPFHELDDLLRVDGIGPVRLEALRPWVTLGGP